MNKASYTATTTASGGVGKYPLSTETLDFIQEQLLLLETLAGLGGSNYILRAPDGKNEGVAVIVNPEGRNEIVTIDARPVFSSSVKFLNVVTVPEDVTADSEVYREARIYRHACFSTSKGEESYDLSTFANIDGKELEPFPTNAVLYAQIKNVPNKVLTYLRDVMAEKLNAKELTGVTLKQIDGLKTPCVLSCAASVALFDRVTDYTLVVTKQGAKEIRQEVIQENDRHFVRVWSNGAWGAWSRKSETAMHIDVKVSGGTVYLRHNALPSNCEIVLLRKKRRGRYRSTGGVKSLPKNKGRRKVRQPKSQYVNFKGIRLSKGEPGKWYVPKCTGVASAKEDGNLIGKELPTLCASLLYVSGKSWRLQGCRKKLILKATKNTKGTAHRAYASLGIQIACLGSNGGKDSGGEIVRLKYRVSQRKTIDHTNNYAWIKTFSID